MKHLISGVPFISQLEHYPTGCESVTAIMALQYLGYRGSVDDFIDRLLPKGQMPAPGPDGRYYGDDPWLCFPGDPYSLEDGWGCFVPVIREAVSRIPGYSLTDLTGASLDQLKTWIDRDIPVLFWGTIGFEAPHRSLCWVTPQGREIQWISPMHCTLLIGYDDSSYIFNDPTSGEAAAFSAEAVQRGFEAQGCQAAIIQPLSEGSAHPQRHSAPHR